MSYCLVFSNGVAVKLCYGILKRGGYETIILFFVRISKLGVLPTRGTYVRYIVFPSIL